MKENYTKANTLDFSSLPEDEIEAKGWIHLFGVENRFQKSLDFIDTEYLSSQKLKSCIRFTSVCMLDAIPYSFELYQTIGFFPITEAIDELDYAIKHALLGSYKASFADLRRALELTVLTVYFTQGETQLEQGSEWYKSKTDTPYFTKMLKELVKLDKYSKVQELYDWSAGVKQHYYNLSDYSHNKGADKSYRELSGSNSRIMASHLPFVNTNTLEIFLELYIKTVSTIATLLALNNPIILKGIDLESKFGLNTPISGFFSEGMAALTFDIIEVPYKEFFKNFIVQDKHVNDMSSWISGMPDITQEQFNEQIKNQNTFISDTNSKDIEQK
ncbi:hypothetical protein [Sphingobacterium bambusae]|uniref:Uncharacterized protein n=1 Tax=Sphingobacterium bambusae TaxID=662858 RepID=A0ABW6BBV3_9SPHI|nr:hypothetical protein [Sphingobacterium bambusae]WPL48458.1 hypothetical protein SCB77_21145 [Sphingobacterium bambusae]